MAFVLAFEEGEASVPAIFKNIYLKLYLRHLFSVTNADKDSKNPNGHLYSDGDKPGN